MLTERIGVLMAAGGAAWEVEALQAVGGPRSGAVLLKRCVDLPDLLASATTGQARVAVVSADLPGLDVDSVTRLRRAGVAVVAVVDLDTAGPLRLPGVFEVLHARDVESLPTVLPAASDAAAADPAGGDTLTERPTPLPTLEEASGAETPARGGEGRVLAVWGPTGAPGRTTVAVGLAAELARQGQEVLLVDADAYGGAVAQHLGVLDEVSGLLSAVRVANAGRLDASRLAALARSVSPGLRVLTGLPRADRWVEVREAAFDAVLDAGRGLAPYVVLDLGFNIEQSDQGFGGGAPQRNLLTLAGLDHADELLVVGSADPVGLARLARGLVELREVVPAATTHVVVNRVRPSLGWGEKEVRAMVEGFVTPASMHFLPDDTAAADRALVAGRPLAELGDSPLGAALAGLAHAVASHGQAEEPRRRGVRGRLRRRRAGTTR